MSRYDDRHGALRKTLSDTQARLDELPEERREGFQQEELKRLEKVLAFAVIVLGSTDPALLSEETHNQLAESLTQLGQTAGEGDPTTCTDGLINAIARLPAARDEIAAGKVKDVVADVQRSSSERVSALAEQIGTARSEIDGVAREIEARRKEWGETVEAKQRDFAEVAEKRVGEFSGRFDELQGAVEAEKQRLESAITEHAEIFRQAQEERAAGFKATEAECEQRIATTVHEAKEQADALLSEMGAMKDRSAQLVGAIGVTGTAERYGKEADEQKSIADRLRIGAVLAGLLAIAIAVLATRQGAATEVAAHLVISAVLGGTATYLARQSARHRGREERGRNLQLDLTAFPVFIQDLPEEKQVEEKIAMIQRSFLGAQSARDHRNESGPTPAGQLLQQRRDSGDA